MAAVSGCRRLAAHILFLGGLACIAPAAWSDGFFGGGAHGSAAPADRNFGDLPPDQRQAIRDLSREQRDEMARGAPAAPAAERNAWGSGLTPEQRRSLRDQIRSQPAWNRDEGRSAR